MDIRCEISEGLYSAVACEGVFPVLLFIGSDKVTGDSLAPICGSILKKMHPHCFIYGDVSCPVHANNLKETVEFIKRVHVGSKILVVDASVGDNADIGRIKFVHGGIKPGKAVGRDFEEVGDFAIAGIVASKADGKISAVRLSHVVQMAEVIAREIYFCTRSFHARRKTSFSQIDTKHPLEGIYS